MNYRLFQYPLPGPPELEDLNAYLGSHRVASVTQHIAQAAGGAMLVFIVQTVAGEAPGKGRSPEAKVDYREVLSAEDFQVFSRLRDERKTIAEAEGVPVYAVFNDSIPHGLLRERLARRFGERRLLALFDALLESHHHTPGRGLPIGALTSQYLGNFHLDAFDHWVNQRQKLPRYLRYMDDLFFLADHFTLRRLLPEAVALLDGLGLRVKDGGVLNRCETGVPWLGFVLYPDRTRLNRAGRHRLRVKMKALEKSFTLGEIREGELQARSASLFAHAGFGDDVAWRRMVARFSRIWDAQEPASRPARRVVEQHGEELPLRDPQQEHARQPQQEQRLPGLSGSRHDDFVSTDDAHSRALTAQAGGDETTGKTPPPADIRPSAEAVEKAGGGAPGEAAP